MPDDKTGTEGFLQTRTTSLYASFSDRLSGAESAKSDAAIDGTYWLADLFFKPVDDGILGAVARLTRIHLSGQQVRTEHNTTKIEFLSRLRCVDSLSDYLILALQTVAEDQTYDLAGWTAPSLPSLHEETGYLGDDGSANAESKVERECDVKLAHISDLIAYSKLDLVIPTTCFNFSQNQPLDAQAKRNPPPYCFVSHSWIDKGMPDTEDAKFYRSFLLLALAVYVDTGIEYFWIDYLSVTQDPDANQRKAEQLAEIPTIIKGASLFVGMCLEIYQYHESAWCALETILFLSENPLCRPLDFIEHPVRSNYRFGMNIVDPSKVNANEKILYSLADQLFECGNPDDLPFLNSQIEKARLNASARVWRLISRTIKAAAQMDRLDDLGILVTSPVLAFLKQSLFQADQKSAEDVLTDINATLPSIGYSQIPEGELKNLTVLLSKCGEMFRVLGMIGFNRPVDQMVRPRKRGAYDLHMSELTTGYAFHNQRKGR